MPESEEVLENDETPNKFHNARVPFVLIHLN